MNDYVFTQGSCKGGINNAGCHDCPNTQLQVYDSYAQFYGDVPLQGPPRASNTWWFIAALNRAFVVFNQIVVVVLVAGYVLGEVVVLPSNAGKYTTDVNYVNDRLDELHNSFRLLACKLDEANQLRRSLESYKNSTKNCTSSDVVEEKIKAALELYDADKLGMMDYALESAGGEIVGTPETEAYPSGTVYRILRLFEVTKLSDPRNAIRAGTLPGECFAFVGSKGRIRVKLSQLVEVTAVTLEYANVNLTGDLGSSPKTFTVLGLPGLEKKGCELGTFTFDIRGKSLQTFQVANVDQRKYRYVELKVTENYGHPEYTCVYRFRVHGRA